MPQPWCATCCTGQLCAHVKTARISHAMEFTICIAYCIYPVKMQALITDSRMLAQAYQASRRRHDEALDAASTLVTSRAGTIKVRTALILHPSARVQSGKDGSWLFLSCTLCPIAVGFRHQLDGKPAKCVKGMYTPDEEKLHDHAMV